MSRTLRFLLVSALLAGCQPSKPEATGSGAPEVAKMEVVPPKVEEPRKEAVNSGIGKFGGVITAAMISDPKTFNYILAQETSSTTPLSFLFEGMAETNGVTGEIQPALAEKWEVSPDNMTYTFTLRKGLKWSDGAPLTADDVLFTYNDLIFNKDVPTDYRDIMMVDDKFPTVKKLDDLRIEIKSPKPYAPFLRTVAGAAIMPKHVLADTLVKKDAKTGKPMFNQTWTLSTDVTKIPGTGPFVFKEFVASQRVVYKRNPHYFRVDANGQRLPYLDGIVILIVKDQNAGVLKFQSGETDILFIDAPLRGQDFAAMKPQEQAGNFAIYKAGPDWGNLFLTFNETVDLNKEGKPYVDPIKSKWFRDTAFRKAVAHAIDKDTIVKNVYQGIATPQVSPESKGSPFYTDKVPTYEYDLAKAAKILEAAGYKKNGAALEDKDGHPVSWTMTTNSENNERKAICQIIKTDLEKLGMKIKFQPIQFNVMVEKTSTGLDWEAVVMGFTGSLDPANGRNIAWSGGRLHLFNQKLESSKHWKVQPFEKEVDALFEEGATTLDDAKRKEVYHKYQNVMMENVPYVYLVNRILLYPARNVIGNLDLTPISGVGGPIIWNAYSLYRTDLK